MLHAMIPQWCVHRDALGDFVDCTLLLLEGSHYLLWVDQNSSTLLMTITWITTGVVLLFRRY